MRAISVSGAGLFGAGGLVFAGLLFGLVAAAPGGEAEKLVGTRPPQWQLSNWINSPALGLKDLKGKVVLVRWWTAPGCIYCAATAPALNEFHSTYQAKGLVVIGVYHHKAATPLDVAKVKESAEKFGFKFPVAVDDDWTTLKRWWLRDEKRQATSATFLIDRKGVVRHVHPGGAYYRGEKAYDTMKARIEELLNEK